MSVLLTSGALSDPVLIDTLKLQQLDDLSFKSLLVILDVISLYTNVLHQEGLDPCRKTLNKRDVLNPPAEDIVQLILFILKKNNFFFNVLHYLQKHKTAMGTRMAPSYANIFMGKLECDLLQQTRQNPTIWWRYIDDTFAVWPHGKQNLEAFFNEINSFHPTIKSIAEWSRQSVTFLDTSYT